MIPFGEKNTRRYLISNWTEKHTADLVRLLEEHYLTFQQYAALQGSLTEALNKGISIDLAVYTEKNNLLNAQISQEKNNLSPYLEQWATLSLEDKNQLMQGKLGELLQKIEVTAQYIETLAREKIPQPQKLSITQKQNPIENWIHLYR